VDLDGEVGLDREVGLGFEGRTAMVQRTFTLEEVHSSFLPAWHID